MKRNSGKQQPITSDDLHAYVDGQLASGRIEQVETYLAQNPSEAAKVAEYRAINLVLGAEFGGVMIEPIPTEMLDVVHRRPNSQMLRIAASLAWLVVGVGIGWVANNGITSRPDEFARLAQGAETAYTVYSPELVHPVEIKAEDSGHLSAWLSNRLGRNVPIPSLNDLGYTFVGGRLLAGYQQPAAMLMYQDTKGRRIILYVSNELAPNTNAPMEFEHSPGAGIITWARNGTGFGVAGGFPEDELMPAANLIRAQISL